MADRGHADEERPSQIGLIRKLVPWFKASICDQPFNAPSCLFVELCSGHRAKR
jgi:hypothetical protein